MELFSEIDFPRQQLERHFYISGKSGTGKSTLLLNIALALIRDGQGLCLVDPHGELAEQLLDRIPPPLTDRIIYLDVSDEARAVGFDPLAQPAHHLLSAMKDIWAESWGPRLEWLLFNALALAVEQRLSFSDIPRLFYDRGFREAHTARLRDPALRAFWLREFPAYNARYREEAMGPILNKLGQFLASPAIRRAILQRKPKLDIPRALRERQAIVANLAKGRIGQEPASLLGSLLVSQIAATAFRGAAAPFYLIVDEFQSFGTESFATILSEARKFNLRLVIAHQFAAQLRPSVLQAILGNAGVLAAFRLGARDAEALAPEFHPLAPSAFTDLFPHSCWLKSFEDLEHRRLSTLPAPPSLDRLETMRARSRRLWSRKV